MKIEIHIRDTKATGKRVGKRNAFVESCNVYNEAGDGLRLGNLAPVALKVLGSAAVQLVRQWKNGEIQGC